jgi:hypothetical protein
VAELEGGHDRTREVDRHRLTASTLRLSLQLAERN